MCLVGRYSFNPTLLLLQLVLSMELPLFTENYHLLRG